MQDDLGIHGDDGVRHLVGSDHRRAFEQASERRVRLEQREIGEIRRRKQR
ncbi:MAG TPA: hypothetical protein VFZ54_18450 [Burkholderiales bacterium]